MAGRARGEATSAGTETFMFEREVETLPRAELEALQLKRLKETLALATREVPHYRRALAAAGLAADDLSSLGQVAELPFTVKDDLRKSYPFGLFAVPRERVARLHASSGTTGKPTVVGYTLEDLDTWAGLMARSLACAGARPGDVVHNAVGYGLFTGGLGFHDGAQRLGCMVVPVSGGQTQRQVMLLADFDADVLAATPSYALNIAEVAQAAGVDFRPRRLRLAALGAEPGSEGLRAEIETILGLRAVDFYGLSEVIGPGVACECGEVRDGLHVWEDHFLCEIVDPENGDPLPPGAEGELVITTLTKQAIPVIRYRTRDITRIMPEPCVCGRSHARIARITGRCDDMLIIRGVNVYPSQIETALVGFADLAPHYQLVVSRDGAMDALAVEVEAAPGVAEDDYGRLGEAVTGHLKATLGLTCGVAVMSPGEVPRSEGKAVRVRDLRKGAV